MAIAPPTNWALADEQVSKHFTVKELIWLPRLSRLATRLDGMDLEVQGNLLKLAGKMDAVREWFGLPINVHVCYRPLIYNTLIKGAKSSSHMEGLAMDFDVEGLPCGIAIQSVLSHGMLETWSVRCENNGETPAWIHLDLREPGPHGRYFIP